MELRKEESKERRIKVKKISNTCKDVEISGHWKLQIEVSKI